jgi:hypothetical protein
VVALITGAVSVATASFALWSSHKNDENTAAIAQKNNDNALAIEQLKIDDNRRTKAEEHQKEMSYYREPLVRSAYELQSRLYNILVQHLLQIYFTGQDSNDRTRSYVVNHTAFVISQYLCWTEIVRRDIQYIDLGRNDSASTDRTRNLTKLQNSISDTFLDDRLGPTLRLFTGEQEATGETLRQQNKDRWDCMGYDTFLTAFPKKKNSFPSRGYS